jgi:DNA-directed RNA polymerase specialized sigma24 family protein
MVDGLCQRSGRECRLLRGKAEILKAETLTGLRLASARQEAETLKPEVEEPNLTLAARVFELLTALDPDEHLRKAPPIKVFLLRFRQNLSLSQIARICDCGKSLVALRLKAIREKLPWQPKQLREMSAQVEAMQDALTDSRARSIYRKGSVYGDEDDGGEPERC